MIILLTIKSNFAILSAMTRQWRIEFEGAYYHILSRGNARRNIFSDNNDRISFLEILGKMSERFEVEVYAYVLMNNHYHLLIKTNKGSRKNNFTILMPKFSTINWSIGIHRLA